MLKSKEKWREILCPKELRNHLGDFIKKCGKNIEKQIRLYFFRSRIILHIYQCTDSGEVQVFLRENKIKNLRPNEFTNCYAERENQRISFLSLKQNHKEIWQYLLFSALHFYDFIFNAPAHHISYFFMTKLASNLSFTLFKILLLLL